MKALIEHPLFKKEIDLDSLNKYLAFEYIPTPKSIFKNVYKLEPSSYLQFTGGKISKRKYYSMEFDQNNKIQFSEALKTLDEELNKSVKKRLVSDVPLGVFLSGGVDSSAIAYYASKNSNEKIKTFSIGFKEASKA